jgi:putative sterol carrier protein
MPEFPTDLWFQDFIARINASEEYAAAAETWEGDVAFVVEAEPDKNVPANVWGLLDLWHGECRGGGIIDEERGNAARYIIRAPYSRWKEVIRGTLEPVRGMMQGKLKLQGDLATIVRNVQAASALVRIVGHVDTVFPDEA